MSVSRKLRDMFHDMTRTCSRMFHDMRISLDLDGYRTQKMIHDSQDWPRDFEIGRQLDLKANTYSKAKI